MIVTNDGLGFGGGDNDADDDNGLTITNDEEKRTS